MGVSGWNWLCWKLHFLQAYLRSGLSLAKERVFVRTQPTKRRLIVSIRGMVCRLYTAQPSGCHLLHNLCEWRLTPELCSAQPAWPWAAVLWPPLLQLAEEFPIDSLHRGQWERPFLPYPHPRCVSPLLSFKGVNCCTVCGPQCWVDGSTHWAPFSPSFLLFCLLVLQGENLYLSSPSKTFPIPGPFSLETKISTKRHCWIPVGSFQSLFPLYRGERIVKNTGNTWIHTSG